MSELFIPLWEEQVQRHGCRKSSRTDGETLQPSGVTEYVNMDNFMTRFKYKLLHF